MKYYVIDVKDGDQFEKSFDTYEEAKEQADYEWNNMTQHDKRLRSDFYICTAELDEDGCIDLNTADVLDDYMA